MKTEKHDCGRHACNLHNPYNPDTGPASIFWLVMAFLLIIGMVVLLIGSALWLALERGA